MSAPGAPGAGRKPHILDGQFFAMLALLAALCALAWWRGGGELLRSGLGEGLAALLRYGMIFAVSLMAAGVAQALIPKARVEALLGADAGLRGILTATAAGALTPSGPFVSMPLAAAMLRLGAAPGAVTAYLCAWSLLALHRFVAWELPLLGARFAALRYAVCLALPIAAGLLVRALQRLAAPPPPG